MGVVNRKSVASPTLPKETVTVEPLGGDVVVCGLLLTQRLALQARLRRLKAEAIAGAGADPALAIVPELLAQTVQDDEGQPIYTVAQWETFGAVHQAEALGLFNVAMRLSGFDGDGDAKNS